MSDHAQPAPSSQTAHPVSSPATYFGLTAIAATVAAIAAFATIALGFEPWMMFIGWVAYSTRSQTVRDGLASGLCFWVGLVLGAIAILALGVLTPSLGQAAFPLAVFVVAAIVIAMRALPVVGNPLALFLGLVAFFASHRAPTLQSVLLLASACTIGMLAGIISQTLQARLRSARA